MAWFQVEIERYFGRLFAMTGGDKVKVKKMRKSREKLDVKISKFTDIV